VPKPPKPLVGTAADVEDGAPKPKEGAEVPVTDDAPAGAPKAGMAGAEEPNGAGAEFVVVEVTEPNGAGALALVLPGANAPKLKAGLFASVAALAKVERAPKAGAAADGTVVVLVDPNEKDDAEF
jgi:hypothetical protein